VSEKLLYDTNIGSVGQHVRRAAMAKDVCADTRSFNADGQGRCRSGPRPVDSALRARVQEQSRVLSRVGERAATTWFEIITQRHVNAAPMAPDAVWNLCRSRGSVAHRNRGPQTDTDDF